MMEREVGKDMLGRGRGGGINEGWGFGGCRCYH